MSTRAPESRRVARLAFIVVAIVAFGFAVGWGVKTVLIPPRAAATSASFTLASVASGSVSSSLALNTQASWAEVPAAANLAAGTVTSVGVKAGQNVNAGETLYKVNERPVVIAAGTVPAYRALSNGDKGEDVEQLQGLLARLGFLHMRPDAAFGSATTTAVIQWQRSLGINPADGTVQAGDVVFVPSLPAHISLDSKQVFRGAQLAAGVEVISTLSAQPAFAIPVSQTQADLIGAGAMVQIHAPDNKSVWQAVVMQQSATDTTAGGNGQVRLMLAPRLGGSVCGSECGQISSVGPVLLSSSVILVPETKGLTVPTAALRTDATGGALVIDQAGNGHPVKVLASARGMSVITGVQVGQRVRVPAEVG